MIHVCLDCLPVVEHFPGPEDERECAVCQCAKIGVEVDPKDLVYTIHAYEKIAQAEGTPLPRPEEISPELAAPPAELPKISALPPAGAAIPALADVPLPPALPSMPPVKAGQ